MKKNTIPVIFATKDDKYVNYLYITMLSMVKNAYETTYYDFYILVPSEFSAKTKKILNKIKSINKNCSINFVDVGNAFKDAYKTKNHISYPTFYRLLAANLLKNIDKCIYLDTDIIVTDDLSDYYNTNVENEYLAGVKAPWYCQSSIQNAERLGLPDTLNYINAGAILMNLKKIREDDLEKNFIQLMDKKFDSQDQDILNYACFGKIKILPYKYNFMTKFGTDYRQYIQDNIYTQTEIDDSLRNPVIIHYADKIKPWDNKNVFWGDIWWKYAKKTPFYKELKKMIIQNRDKTILAKPNKVSKLLLFSFIPLLKVEYYDQKTTYLLFNFIPILEKKMHKNKIYYKLFAVLPFLKCKIKGEL